MDSHGNHLNSSLTGNGSNSIERPAKYDDSQPGYAPLQPLIAHTSQTGVTENSSFLFHGSSSGDGIDERENYIDSALTSLTSVGHDSREQALDRTPHQTRASKELASPRFFEMPVGPPPYYREYSDPRDQFVASKAPNHTANHLQASPGEQARGPWGGAQNRHRRRISQDVFPRAFPSFTPRYGYPRRVTRDARMLPLDSRSLILSEFPSLAGSIWLGSNGPGQQPGSIARGKPARMTTIAWEDEVTLCILVEVGGIHVARRCDNNMVNGTKLLNLAGVTRGRRDGMLKLERVRDVVKTGPMHLKGVWIAYERAIHIAGNYNILDLLYPLFVADLQELLYHPTNITRMQQIVRAAEIRNPDFSVWRREIPRNHISVQAHAMEDSQFRQYH